MDTHELPTMRGPGFCGDESAAPADAAVRDADPAPAARDEPRPIIEPLLALDFAINTSVRYHAKRRAWFDTLHRLCLAVIALGSSAAVAALYGGLGDAGIDLTLWVAGAAGLELCFGFAERARAEDALYRRLNDLATEIAEAKTVDEALLRRWDKRRLLIRADCGERLLVLHRICYNLEAEARGCPEDTLYAVTPLQRLAAPLVSLPPHRPRRLPA